MEINEYTKDPRNFKDESHLTNKNLHEALCVLLNTKTNAYNFGTTLTKQNIDNYLRDKEYLNPKPKP
jgi:hypothetical protein